MCKCVCVSVCKVNYSGSDVLHRSVIWALFISRFTSALVVGGALAVLVGGAFHSFSYLF